MDAPLIARVGIATVAGAALGWRCGTALRDRGDGVVLARALALLALASAMFAATSAAVGETAMPPAGVTGTTLVLLSMGVVLGVSAAASGSEPRWTERVRLGGSCGGIGRARGALRGWGVARRDPADRARPRADAAPIVSRTVRRVRATPGVRHDSITMADPGRWARGPARGVRYRRRLVGEELQWT